MDIPIWFERTFAPVPDEKLLPNILERLEGSPVRIGAKLDTISPQLLTKKDGEKWSILEHLGHLNDLEPLWLGRVHDIQARKEILRSADLSNAKTHQANHNAATPIELVATFISHRQLLVEAFRNLSPDDLDHHPLHPRLMTPMRAVDLAFFVAEHDDHHMAFMTKLGNV